MASPAFQRLAWIATGLTLVVIVLGAWVRLTDAGLGCPDWPGCYGKVTWPRSTEAVDQANRVWPERPVESGKAWREMVHRYFAGALGLLVLALAVIAWRDRRRPGQLVGVPLFLLGLIVFQALLGMWTVTLLLKPAVVMAHLLGGMAIFALLCWITARSLEPARAPSLHARKLHLPVLVAMAIVIAQIALGGWVSTNYAALACADDFPTCLGQWWPETDFREGFVLWRGIGVDYEGGILDQPARAAIHLAHRLGAVVVLGVLSWLIWHILRTPDLRAPGVVLGLLLLIQLTLGVLNVVLGLPLAIAVAHNGVAALLLGMMVYLLHRTRPAPATP